MADVTLVQGEANPNDVRLIDPEQTSIPLAANSSIGFATAAALTITALFAADSAVAFSSNANLSVAGPLLADSAVFVSSSATLSGATSLSAASSVAFSSVAGPLTMQADLAASSSSAFSTTAALLVGGIPLAADSGITFQTQGSLRGLAAELAASSSIAFSMSGDMAVGGASATTAAITFAGVPAAAGRVRLTSLAIEDVLNERANSCRFILNGSSLAIGTDVKIGLQNVLPGSLLFAGTVQKVTQRYESKPANLAWDVYCEDYTFLINRRLVVGTWTNISATTVAQNIVTTNAPGFSTASIAAGLPAITITFNGVPVMSALTEIATLVGGYTYVDYNKVVHLGPSETVDPPAAIDGTGRLLMNAQPLTYLTDASQARTRIDVKGGTASVSGPEGFNIPAGTSLLPLDDASIFSTGTVITEDAQIIAYTGVAPGGVASIVTANVPAPASAPIPALAPGVAGGLVGTYRWKVAFANAQGETTVGPASGSLFAPSVNTPVSGPGVGPPGTLAIGPLVGVYSYAITNVTTLGETLHGPTVSRTAVALAAPPSPIVGDAPAPGNLQVGAVYKYVTTFVTAYGETGPSAPTIYGPSALALPTVSSFSGQAFGGLYGGPYLYGVTLVTKIGESAPVVTTNIGSGFATSAIGSTLGFSGSIDSNGRMSAGIYQYTCALFSDTYGEAPLSPAFQQIVNPPGPVRLLMNLPAGLGSVPNWDGLRVYRAFAPALGAAFTPFMLNAEFRSIPAQYWDILSQGECGNPYPISPVRPSAGVRMQCFVGASAEPGVIARRIYRSKAGGSELFLVGEIQNNVGAFFTDPLFDTQLATRSPAVQTTGRSANVTAIALSTRPGVIARRLYRTAANGSVYYQIAEIRDNTTTTFVDNVPDSALIGATVSATSTAGGDQHLLTSIQPGPTGTLARKVYRTVSGGSEYKFVGQISDNTTTSFLDAVPDANLGATAPLTNSAGASAVNVTIPIGGTSVSQRIVYRTAAGGSDYKYVGTVNDNTTTVFLDTAPDTALGRLPLNVSTIGALAGDTSVMLQSTAGWPTSGWFNGDGQIIRYTGISGNALTGIPPLLAVTSITRSSTTATVTTVAPHGFVTGQRIVVLGADQSEYTGTRTVTVTGASTFTYDVAASAVTPATGTIKVSQAGAITGALAGGLTVTTIPMLTGVSGVIVPVKAGSQVALWVVRNSTSGQAALAAAEGGDGVHEYLVTDSTLDSVAACAARGDAELTLYQFARIEVAYTSRDTKTRSGKTVHLALAAPQSLSGDFVIQTVSITQIDLAPRTAPLYSVTASNTRFSLEDLLRHVLVDV